MGKPYIPCAFRVYNKPICGQTATDPFQAILVQAKGRGFEIEGNVPKKVEVPKKVRVVHLSGFGFVKVFRTVARDGENWTTNDLKDDGGGGGQNLKAL